MVLSLTADAAPIIIVDDNPDDILLLRRGLVRAGVRNAILTFESAREAVNHLESMEPHQAARALVFCDLKMPEMDGFAVLKTIRGQAHLATLRIIIVSGCALEQDVERARQLGADGYIEKIPSPEILVRCVEENPGFPHPGTRQQRFQLWESSRS